MFGNNFPVLNVRMVQSVESIWTVKYVWEPFPHLKFENGSECGIGMDCPDISL